MSAAPRRHRVVVVGHGMVGSRLVHELCRTGVPGRPPPVALDVTVLGEEPYAPYNRLLLGEVVAGRADVAGLALPTAPAGPGGPRVRQGRAATALDLVHGEVLDDAGDRHPFDTVVLATGARARVPRLAGLAAGRGRLPRGVTALRTVDDCRQLLVAAAGARRAVVLGGGLLGLEAAVALAGRGVAVTVLHHGGHVLDRQLDGDSGLVVAAALADLEVDVRCDVRPVGVEVTDGAVGGVLLDDGEVAPADLLLLAAGVEPRVDLAVAAGLPVDVGVLVGADLRSVADRRVAAVGDCAQPPTGCPGLLAPGWEQAGRLAQALRHPAQQPDAGLTAEQDAPASSVVRLKATGLDVVTMGETQPRPGTARVLALSDPVARRSVRLVVRGDRLVGATCVGAGRTAVDLVVAYERRTPLPPDPAVLLVPAALAAPAADTGSPTRLPDAATVCRCNGVAKRDVVSAWSDGARSVADVALATRASTGCGGCTATVQGLLDWLAAADPDTVEGPTTGAGPDADVTSQSAACGCAQSVPATKPNEAVR